MNIKVQAAVDVAKIMLVSAVIALAVVLAFEYVSISTIGWVLGSAAFAYLIYVFWYIRVGQLTYESRLKSAVDHKS